MKRNKSNWNFTFYKIFLILNESSVKLCEKSCVHQISQSLKLWPSVLLNKAISKVFSNKPFHFNMLNKKSHPWCFWSEIVNIFLYRINKYKNEDVCGYRKLNITNTEIHDIKLNINRKSQFPFFFIKMYTKSL